jgi:hypothetical protein
LPQLERLVDDQIVKAPLEQFSNQPEDTLEEEGDIDKNTYAESVKVCETYISNEAVVRGLTSMSLPNFNVFVEECSLSLKMTTYRGTTRESAFISNPIPSHCFIFLTLFWQQHYLTIKVLSHLFKIHQQSCTRILKQMTITLVRTLENEIHFPSDEEMEEFQNIKFQNLMFLQCMCTVDGTKIQISQPKNSNIQTKTYSGKKKQNSLNVMIVTKLNSEVIYHSPLQVGVHGPCGVS